MAKQVFIFGHNMPGYLPESDNDVCETWDEAKRCAIAYMESDADFYDDLRPGDDTPEVIAENHELAEELSSECEDLNLDNGPEWGVIVGNVSYWISQEVIDDQEWKDIQNGGY